MRTSLFTQFDEGTAVARLDTALNEQLMAHYQTATLLTAEPGLNRTTCIALAWNIQQARMVDQQPDRICGVISSATCANALAVWGDEQRHWVVVTHGMMMLLQAAAERNAARLLAAFPNAFATAAGQRLTRATPLQGFQTMLGAFLYFGAMSFVASHELGHHLAGHGAFFNTQDQQDGLRARWDVSHALERQADAIGVGGAALSVNKLLRRFFTGTALAPSHHKEQLTLIAIVLAAGVLTIAARLLPVDVKQAAADGHPPNLYRMMKIAALLMRPLRALPLLDDATRKRIRTTCLDIVLTPAPPGAAATDRGDPATVRLEDMQRASADPSFHAYMNQLDAGFLLFEEKLRAAE